MTMGDLSKNFSRWEFRCKCGCGLDTVDYQLLSLLERLRIYYGSRGITINSGSRCPEYNKKIGGKPKSQHLIGRAADFTVAGASPKLVQRYLDLTYPDGLGIGSYNTFTHVDTRTGGPARWS